MKQTQASTFGQSGAKFFADHKRPSSFQKYKGFLMKSYSRKLPVIAAMPNTVGPVARGGEWWQPLAPKETGWKMISTRAHLKDQYA